MARHGTLTKRDFERVAGECADLFNATRATILDKNLSRLEALAAQSLIFTNFVNALAGVLAKSNTTFDKRRFLDGALAPLSAGHLELVVPVASSDRKDRPTN